MAKTEQKEPDVIEIDTSQLENTKKKDIKKTVKNIKNSEVTKVFVYGAKITLKGFGWVLKQVVSLMVEGIKGVGSGISESTGSSKSSSGTRTRTRSASPSYIDNRSYTVVMPPERKKRPIWYIPTREEEIMDNLNE